MIVIDFAGKEGKTKRFFPLGPLQDPHCGGYPETGGNWLCVQHQEDGANACTSADESIWRQLFPYTAARFNEGP